MSHKEYFFLEDMPAVFTSQKSTVKYHPLIKMCLTSFLGSLPECQSIRDKWYSGLDYEIGDIGTYLRPPSKRVHPSIET